MLYVVYLIPRSVKDLTMNCLESDFTVIEMAEAKDVLCKVADAPVLGPSTKHTDPAK